jgi:hypothetical protein
MANNLILVVLIAGGFIGWCLFAVTFGHIICSRHEEIKMINEIQTDLKIVKEEIKNLK